MLKILRATAYVHYTTSLTLSLPFFRNTPIIPHSPPQARSQYRNYTTSGSDMGRVSGDTGAMSEVAVISSDNEGSNNEIRSPTNHYVSDKKK